MAVYKLIKIYKVEAPTYWNARKAFNEAQGAGNLEKLLVAEFVKEDDHKSSLKDEVLGQIFGWKKR